MTRLITIMAFLISLSAASNGGPGYSNALKNSVNNLDTVTSVESVKPIIKDLEGLANENKTEWLAWYWAAYSNVLAAYLSGDSDQKDALLDDAQKHLNKASLLENNNAEIHVLQSWIYSARIEVSPMSRGMTYLPRTSNELEKAKEIDPNNPRYHYLKGMILYNSPAMFGGNKSKACDHFKTAMKLFKKESPKSDIHPGWGKDQTLEALQKCK